MTVEPFGYERLQIWIRSMDLVESIYRLCESMPAEERFGLKSQMRRAVVSIPANIAEGYGRESAKSFAQFIRVAIGSSYELRTLSDLSLRLGIADQSVVLEAKRELGEISRMLTAFHKHLEAKSSSIQEAIAEYGALQEL